MNTILRYTTVAATVALAALWASFAPAALSWQLQRDAKANFEIDGMLGVDVRGTLDFKSAAMSFDPARPEAGSMQAVLSVGTIATGIGKRDRHLKSDDYFEAGKYPDITFQSTRIEAKAARQYQVTGNLRIKAVTRPVVLPFTFTQQGDEGLFQGSFRINRVDYSIGNGKETGMGKEVRISLKIPVRKA